jgi:transcriptional regulator with XRE-family HTH domain
MTLGLVIKLVRFHKGYSRTAFAKALGIGTRTVYNIENDKAPISIKRLERISKVLEEPISFIFLMLEGPK